MRGWYGRTNARHGSTIVEYALFLTLIGGAVVVACNAVAFAMNRSFMQATYALLDHSKTTPTGYGQATEGDEPGPIEIDQIETAQRTQLYQCGAVAIALAAGAGIWFQLYCRRTRQAAAATCELPEEVAQTHQEAIFNKRQQILRALSTDTASLLDSQLHVKQVMSRRLVFVQPKLRRAEVGSTLQTHGVRHLLVCNDRGMLVGIISDRDLSTRSGKTAGEIMTRQVDAVEPTALIQPAITQMINKRISCLPVVEDGIPCGVLTSTDLMMTLQCALQVLQKLDIEPPATSKTISGQAAYASGA